MGFPPFLLSGASPYEFRRGGLAREFDERSWRDNNLDRHRGTCPDVACARHHNRDPRGPPLQACRAGPPGSQSQFDLAPTDACAPTVIRPDQRIEADAQLVRELGLHGIPTRLGELTGNDSGIAAEDLEALREDVETARVSAARIARKVRTNGSGRVFEVRGGPAPSPEPPGTLAAVVLRYERRRGRASRARSSTAPDRGCARFAHPAHRGRALPDVVPRARPQARARQQRLRPGGRRHAMRRRHRARRRADRCGRRGQPVATRPGSAGSGRVVSRMQPAIIRGERRMLRIVNVPLSTGAVAGFAVDVQDLEDARAELVPPHRVPARARRPDDRGDGAVRCRPDA